MKTIVAVLVVCLLAGAALAQQTGIPIDRLGGPTIDPTKNVSDLSAASNKRQDDLRELSLRYEKEIADLRAQHEKELRTSEAARLDSIRQVDRDDVAKTVAAANVAIDTLAKRTLDLSTTLAKQVTDTATATEARFSAFQSDTNKRLSALELSASERTGKSTISDPAFEQLKITVEKIAAAQTENAGKTAGSSGLWTMLVAGAAVVIAGLGVLTRQQRAK